jgi:dihydrolipoamide dehydrogenase
MAKSDRYDVIVIGAGPGGYSAGIRAGELGLKTCVIEQDTLGGVCLNWGCIPTKNLIQQAGIFSSRLEMEGMGCVIDAARFDYGRVHDQSRAVVRTLIEGVEYLFKKNKVSCVRGTATIVSQNEVVLDGATEVTGEKIIIATGSRPLEIDGFEFDEDYVLSSTGILSLEKLPESLIILGGGAIGCEFAYLMNRFGVQVHLVEMEKQILPGEDARVAAVLKRSFTESGIKVITGARADFLEKASGKVVVVLTDKTGNTQRIEARKTLCALGRTPNTETIGLEHIGLQTERGFIPVGDFYQTAVSGVYAVGDVVDTPLLAHVAAREGEIAVEHIAGRSPQIRIDFNEVPSAVYCEPQVASFGLREERAKEAKTSYKRVMLPYRSVGKAVAAGITDGMFKMLYDPETHEILGAHIVGHDATELIHEILLAKTAGLSPGDIVRMVHAHPTLSEGIMNLMRMADAGS